MPSKQRNCRFLRKTTRKVKQCQRDCLWWVLEIFQTEQKKVLLFKRIYRTSKQLADDNPLLFENYNQVLTYRKRYSPDVPNPIVPVKRPILKRITVSRKVFDFEPSSVDASRIVALNLKTYNKS